MFNTLKIPVNKWGEAVEPRALFVEGYDDPWNITVATVTDPRIITGLFGSGHTRTMQIDVACHTETKKVKTAAASLVNQTIEVEVGMVGAWDRYKSFGGRGLRVLEDHSEALGTILTLTLDKNPKAWKLPLSTCSGRNSPPSAP